jgi:uncharacterized phage protein (TIGR01671 family)
MKREILFKGKLSHSKEWIEGNLIIAQNGKPYIIPFDVFEPDGHHLIIDSDNPFWVDENTISQFINQTDKNGKKIFEGDYDSDGDCIVWCKECNGFEFAGIEVETKEQYLPCHRCDGNYFFGDQINDFEIVGNVAD